MDQNYVKSTIEGLKSTSSSRVQETLLKIRSKVTINDSGIKLFRENGGLEHLLPHLRKPNERILDITLSILGNCCLEEESSLAVGKLNIFGPLINIIKTVCRDSIVGRACRVIGNLAQRSLNAEGLHNNGAVSALVELIESRDKNTSYPTLTMAVRAIRQLWMVTEKRFEMLSLHSVRCIAILLTTECETAGIIKSPNPTKDPEGLRKSQEELITGILKCLGYFTTHSTVLCAVQLEGDGRGFQSLVALTKKFESLALKCLMNLCYVSPCCILLGNAGFVECLVGILQKIPDVSAWPEGAALSLAHLSDNSVNRSRLRHCGGLPLLVAAARLHQHSLHALLQYIFDDTLFQILVNEGLITLLTDELTQYLTTMNYEHNYTEPAEISSEASEILKEPQKDTESQQPNDSTNEGKTSLFARRKSHNMTSHNEDELKVVIERDNMIVGFVDAVDSDATDDSQSEDDSPQLRYKGIKRPRSCSPKTLKKTSQFNKMASKVWSAGVYWEPKSPEWPSMSHASGSRVAMSPDRSDHGPLSPYSDGNESGFSPEYRGFSSNKRARWDWSPESGVSSGETSSMSPYATDCQWSPSSSGPTSPFSTHEDTSDSEVSGRYSPVCSDNEGEAVDLVATNTSTVELDAAQVAHDLDELIMEDDESSLEDKVSSEADASIIMTKKASSRIACVLVLLFRVSHGPCHSTLPDEPVSSLPQELLTGPECVNALLDYVERCKRPWGRPARILARILSNALCLVNILKHRLALRLHKMSVNSNHPPTKCQQCKQSIKLSSKLLSQLTILAESSYGIGEISYQLLKGSSSMKQTLSLTLPYIVRTEKTLKKFFIDCSALKLLFTIITEATEETQSCVIALSKLANNVHIKDPKSLENRFKDQSCTSYEPILNGLSNDDMVIFELDDLSTVKANRAFLCQNSEVFNAMLMGCFKESEEKCVRIKNVSKPALEYLFTLLHSGLNNAKCDVTVFPLAQKLKTNLEVLLLADRFLFEKLKNLLSSAILQFQLSPETADQIYVWSLNEGMGFLCVESVAYLLTGEMAESQRTRCFEAILNSEYKDQWLEDIKSMILRQLVK